MNKEQKAYLDSTKAYHRQLYLCLIENDLMVKNLESLIKLQKQRIAQERKQKKATQGQLNLHKVVLKNWKLKNKIK